MGPVYANTFVCVSTRNLVSLMRTLHVTFTRNETKVDDTRRNVRGLETHHLFVVVEIKAGKT